MGEWTAPESGLYRVGTGEEPTLRCPGCDEPWADVPLGHDVAFPMDGGKPTCSDVSRPVSPIEFMTAKPQNVWLESDGTRYLKDGTRWADPGN